MKPCSSKRQSIAWLALDALEAYEAAALRDHLASCEGCRQYLEEISSVTRSLKSGAPDSRLEASEFFHQRVADRVRASESSPVLDTVAAWLRGALRGWRVAVPASAVVLIVCAAIITTRQTPVVPAPAPHPAQAVASPAPGTDLSPTIANYQRVASQSLETFDELLTRQARKRLPPAPVYAASDLVPAIASY